MVYIDKDYVVHTLILYCTAIMYLRRVNSAVLTKFFTYDQFLYFYVFN